MLVLAGLALISFIAFVAGVVDKACDATLIGIVLPTTGAEPIFVLQHGRKQQS